MRRRAQPAPPAFEPFRTIVADPGWPYGDKLPGKSRGAAKNYKTMRVDQIARYLESDAMMTELHLAGVFDTEPPPALVAKDARLFLWRVHPMQDEALHVMRAWGFGSPVSECIWNKTTLEDERLLERLIKFHRTDSEKWTPETLPKLLHQLRALDNGMGRTFRLSHEVCLVGRRGRPERLSASVKSSFFAPVREHSEKPTEFFDLVEKLSPGPYLELFSGGHRREGWMCLGENHREEAAL